MEMTSWKLEHDRIEVSKIPDLLITLASDIENKKQLSISLYSAFGILYYTSLSICFSTETFRVLSRAVKEFAGSYFETSQGIIKAEL